jgi:hypothetical protein
MLMNFSSATVTVHSSRLHRVQISLSQVGMNCVRLENSNSVSEPDFISTLGLLYSHCYVFYRNVQ